MTEESIDNIHCDEERFRQQSEFHLNQNKPIDKHFSLLRSDFCLLVEVVRASQEEILTALDGLVDLVPVLEVALLAQKAFAGVTHITDQALLNLRQAQDGRPFLLRTYSCAGLIIVWSLTWVA